MIHFRVAAVGPPPNLAVRRLNHNVRPNRTEAAAGSRDVRPGVSSAMPRPCTTSEQQQQLHLLCIMSSWKTAASAL